MPTTTHQRPRRCSPASPPTRRARAPKPKSATATSCGCEIEQMSKVLTQNTAMIRSTHGVVRHGGGARDPVRNCRHTEVSRAQPCVLTSSTWSHDALCLALRSRHQPILDVTRSEPRFLSLYGDRRWWGARHQLNQVDKGKVARLGFIVTEGICQGERQSIGDLREFHGTESASAMGVCYCGRNIWPMWSTCHPHGYLGPHGSATLNWCGGVIARWASGGEVKRERWAGWGRSELGRGKFFPFPFLF